MEIFKTSHAADNYPLVYFMEADNSLFVVKMLVKILKCFKIASVVTHPHEKRRLRSNLSSTR